MQVGLRLPRSVVERIDLHVERLRTETGLLGITRSDAATALLVRGLQAVERGGKKPQPPRADSVASTVLRDLGATAFPREN